MKAIWKWFDGSKTIFFSIIIIILQAGVLTFLSPEWTQVLLSIMGALMGGSLVHHIAKKATGENK